MYICDQIGEKALVDAYNNLQQGITSLVIKLHIKLIMTMLQSLEHKLISYIPEQLYDVLYMTSFTNLVTYSSNF